MRTSRRAPLTAIEHYAALYDEVLRPFVYRRYLDFSVFESLREMKAMISREVERRELQDNVKLGPGGIREIEFIVQSFQLMRGGSDRRLQSRELRTVLPLLVGQRFLRREAVTELDAAYRYLRVVENRLQQWNDEQTHQLPEDEIGARAAGARDGRERLGCACRRSSPLHRQRVAQHFAQTVFGPARIERRSDVRPGATEERARASAGGRCELSPPLDQLRDTAYYRRLDETGRRRLHELLGATAAAASRSPSRPTRRWCAC